MKHKVNELTSKKHRTVDKIMSENKKQSVEFKTIGTLDDKGVRVTDQSSIDALISRGYGTLENKVFTLTFFEALYLLDRGMLEIRGASDKIVDFQEMLQCYGTKNDNAWANYIVYRDLRSRGYVVREGFGCKIDFRIYERGSYGKDAAPYLILSTQEGKPIPINDLANVLQQCQNQKKELILAVINRRGEIVHYSVSQLTFE
jgi:tRNA-intron endonuclease